MSSAETYGNVVLKNLIMLAVTLQDTSFRVRSELLNKFTLLCINRKLGPNFYVLTFITAHDPEREIRERARNWVVASMRRLPIGEFICCLELQHFDMLFIRLLHLLAHHPDFTVTTEDISNFISILSQPPKTSLYSSTWHSKRKPCVMLILMCSHLYVLSELAQHLIRARAKNRGWTLNTYPGKVKIPGDIFRALPNHEAASKISKKEYLPEENLQWLSSAGKPIRSPTSKSRKTGDDKDKAPRKRKATASGRTNGTTKKARRPKKTNTWREQSADEESDEDLTSESDEDQDNVKTQHHANTTSTREERRLRRSRGGEELEPKQDSEQSGEEEGSGEEESGRESGRESDGETEEEVDQGGDKDKSVGVARKKRRVSFMPSVSGEHLLTITQMRGPRLTHRKRRASRPSKP
ncbi:hypothetical protein AG1IA_01658 [Rhizoctonia solani AG-1 IA]|uniref:Uncharacterized protein n=1 Tax=Thanatephorus cucumeris (strain AG1-IA) TaxID=983506 RepID=L8X278_THACA|nr:hypothetical protein AG1IA_01658 [Rhizoctonia solani AG-1 IA]